MKKNKKSKIVSLAMLIVVIVVFVVACNKSKTTKVNDIKRFSSNDVHEYVMDQYFSRAQVSNIDDVLKNNIDSICTNGLFDEIKFQTFFMNNSELFYDSSSMQKVVSDAGLLYNFEISNIVYPFSEEFNKLYHDINHEHGGANLLRSSREDRKNELLYLASEKMKPKMTTKEYDKITEYINLYSSENQNFDEIRALCIGVIEDAISDYSILFKEVMLFTYNNTFYQPDDPELRMMDWVGKFTDTVSMWLALERTKYECHDCCPYLGGTWDHIEHQSYAASEAGGASFHGGMVDVALDIAQDVAGFKNK